MLAPAKNNCAISLARRQGRVADPLAAAHRLASAGFAVLPGGPRKHPPLTHWPDRGTTRPATLSRWGHRFRGYFGIALRASGAFAVDLDGPEASAAWDALVAAHGGHDPTFTIHSARGRKLLFKRPGFMGAENGSQVRVEALGAVNDNYKCPWRQLEMPRMNLQEGVQHTPQWNVPTTPSGISRLG